MRKGLFTGLSLAAAVWMATPSVWGDDAKTDDHKTAASDHKDYGDLGMLPPGVESREVTDGDIGGLRALLSSASSYAVTTDSFGDLVNHLNDQDRKRISQDDSGKDSELQKSLDGRINQIRGEWRNKYGKDPSFNKDADNAAYGEVRLLRGEITDPNQVVQHWPVPAVRMQKDSPTGADGANDPNNGDVNLDKGREVAIAILPGMRDKSPVAVSIIGEVQNWKIDVPNSLTAERLRGNLLAHLTYFGDNAKSWPQDEHKAQAMLTRHVMLALYDVPIDNTTGEQRANTADADK
ncbi:MAG: hypothetical protein QM770_08310 [Tepidisphaeraceae bacterium]